MLYLQSELVQIEYIGIAAEIETSFSLFSMWLSITGR